MNLFFPLMFEGHDLQPERNKCFEGKRDAVVAAFFVGSFPPLKTQRHLQRVLFPSRFVGFMSYLFFLFFFSSQEE